MEFINYQQLVDSIKEKNSEKEKIESIIEYFNENVEVDYVIIEHINEIVTIKFMQYVDRLYPNTNQKFREKALSFLKNSSNISNTYWERIKKIYLTPTISDVYQEKYPTLQEALTSIEPEVIEENGLLKKGVAFDICKFAKKLCDDVGLKSLILNGISSGRMRHYWLDICVDGEELFYDITFALYIRDNFCNIGKQYKSKEWLGITPKQLYKNQPTRIIFYPQGYSLEDLGLNNKELNMKDFFDTTA